MVIVSAGGVSVDESVADAVLWQPYGGQAAGDGLASVLYGDSIPSARLPLTFYYQAWADKMAGNVSTSILAFDLEVGEGRTHRYLKNRSLAQHHFGFGLSYGRFAYSGLGATKAGNGSLIATVTVKRTDTAGHIRSAAEIVQLYLSGATLPGQATPRHNLVAFARIELAPAGIGRSSTQTVRLEVLAAGMETAMVDGTRKVVAGQYTLSAGGHQPGYKEGGAGSSGPCVSVLVQLG